MVNARARLGGRKPDPKKYVYHARPEEAYLTKFIWDHRYIMRAQMVDMFFGSTSMADKVLAHMIKEDWIRVERLLDRRPAKGRALRSRNFQRSAEIDRYFTGRPRVYSVGERGLDMLRAHGEVWRVPRYTDQQQMFIPHHVAAVEVWRTFEMAVSRYRGHEFDWLGPRRALQLIEDMRERAALTPGERQRDVLPDAFFTYRAPRTDGSYAQGHFFVEVDMGTESETRLRGKFAAYEGWVNERDRQGLPTWEIRPPMSVFPYILVIAVDRRRRDQIAAYLARWPERQIKVLVTSLNELSSSDPLTTGLWWEQYAAGRDPLGKRWALVELLTQTHPA